MLQAFDNTEEFAPNCSMLKQPDLIPGSRVVQLVDNNLAKPLLLFSSEKRNDKNKQALNWFHNS